jgi:hypothetical protein
MIINTHKLLFLLLYSVPRLFENPRVGGSIPPLGTIIDISLAPASIINDLAHYFKRILRFVPRFVPPAVSMGQGRSAALPYRCSTIANTKKANLRNRILLSPATFCGDSIFDARFTSKSGKKSNIHY